MFGFCSYNALSITDVYVYTWVYTAVSIGMGYPNSWMVYNGKIDQ